MLNKWASLRCAEGASPLEGMHLGNNINTAVVGFTKAKECMDLLDPFIKGREVTNQFKGGVEQRLSSFNHL